MHSELAGARELAYHGRSVLLPGAPRPTVREADELKDAARAARTCQLCARRGRDPSKPLVELDRQPNEVRERMRVLDNSEIGDARPSARAAWPRARSSARGRARRAAGSRASNPSSSADCGHAARLPSPSLSRFAPCPSSPRRPQSRGGPRSHSRSRKSTSRRPRLAKFAFASLLTRSATRVRQGADRAGSRGGIAPAPG